ncbi:THAP domain-containing protein 9 [Cyphomyrmex costatus]|uniref:THAP domain-containing protein 9 n=1 Tax=Cyphomyrmex costatus TaxID=456900 RepID=A0A151I701_9HYME|nr:THAP domain-containing protein 9 [Cyphomyrmex costatus]
MNVSMTEKEIIKRHLSRKRKRPFPTAIKTFAATLQFYSTKAYEYVRKTFLNILLHPQTIKKWYSSIDAKPGITLEALRTVQAKINEAAAVEKILYFSLVIDDMSIKEEIEIEDDKYYGYVDFGTNPENNDSIPRANHACVLLLVCINGNWKIPVAYYFIKSLNGAERANVIEQVLASLHEVGAKVLNVTMDGTASNISTARCLGANIAAQDLKPYFIHPQSKEKVYIILDACHMIKLIRNSYATSRNMHDSYGNKIDWQYIVHLVKLQEQKGL